MEPKSSENSPEQLPTPSVDYLSSPEQVEQAPIQPERAELSQERGQEQHHAATATPLPVPVSVQLPTPIQPASDDSGTKTDDDAPPTAADEDLIEKEWVDKAKKIIVDTKEDPHRREREVGKLQADYLRKRYGKDLGSTT